MELVDGLGTFERKLYDDDESDIDEVAEYEPFMQRQ